MVKRMKYLIDTENIGSAWTELLPLLGRNDEILLFFTANSPGIPYKDLQQIMNHPFQMELIPCNTGRNGLDFQLSSYLGYLLRSSSKAQYVILSRDQGYDPLVQFWKERGADIVRCDTKELLAARRPAEQEDARDQAEQQEQTAAPEGKAARPSRSKRAPKGSAKKKPEPIGERMESLVPEEFRTPEDIRDMMSIVREYYPSGLQEVNKALLSRFGYDGGNDLYRALKPSFRAICAESQESGTGN